MGNKSLEERIEALEKRNERLELEVERAKAVGEIQNLMSRYEFYHSILDGESETECFAHHTPGTRLEMMTGIYEGYKGVQKFFSQEKKGTLPPGSMVHHTLTTPIIEVAGDGKTAKGAWICPGEETRVNPEGKPMGAWMYMKYGADFVKEDGQWKIWHLIPYSIFHIPFEVPLPEQREMPKEMPKPPNWEELKPDRESTRVRWTYSPTARYPGDQPWPPVPYETWDNSMSYIP